MPEARMPPLDSTKKPGWPSRIATMVFLLAVCIGIAWWIRHDQKAKAELGKQRPQQQVAPLDVTVAVVRRENAPVVLNYLGQTEASQTVDIRARVKGFLETRGFDEGGRVTKGRVLFTIQRDTFQAALDAAKASLAQAQANADQAERQVNRFTELVSQNAAARTELEDWQTARAVAMANIVAAKAGIEQAELDLGYTTIHSPLDGVIGRALQDVGNYVGPGDPSVKSELAVVQQIDPIDITFPVSEDDLLTWKQLTDGSAARKQLTVDAELANGETYPPPGTINFVDIRVAPGTGTAVVRATFPNPQSLLRPGQFIRVHIRGLERKDVLTVPQRAVIQSPNGAMVYVVNEKNQAEPRSVTLGQWLDDRWIIGAGLSVGDKVVLDRLMQLRPASPVRIVEQPAASLAPLPQSTDKP
ncbi:MAG: efflux RND transporter periplasmic adaptor subunit [Phycisphaerales bacterium]